MKLISLKGLRTKIITELPVRRRYMLGGTMTVDKADQHKPSYIVQFKNSWSFT